MKTPFVQPYLFFNGRCDEALEFYKKALGAQVDMLMRFKDSPDPQQQAGCGPVPGDKVMHASFRIGDTHLMASDGRCEGKTNFDGFSLSISVPDEAAADKLFGGLADGGKVLAPLTKTFFSPRFGMVADKFGVMWMILVTQPSHG